MLLRILLASLALPGFALTQSCGPKPSGSIQPSLASGYQMQVVATGLSAPRGIMFDKAGNLLVIEQGSGIASVHQISYENGCAAVTSSQNLTESGLMLNHGIEMSQDGNTFYASSNDAAYSFDYNSSARSVSNRKIVVTNLTQPNDHVTRTLLLPRKVTGMLVVSRGSSENIDFQASELNSQLSTVKAFNLTASNGTAYNYITDGELLGWGLRNEVGIGEHPTSGGIWGVENSADQLNRTGVDIHEDNPGEELNFLGYLNGTKGPFQGQNFGYPWCFSTWTTQSLPESGNLTVGSQFAVDASPDSNNENRTDEYCAAQAPPRLVFQAHMAPLDIKWNTSTEAWVTFHGSWDRSEPVGYRVSTVGFNDNGDPTEPANSTKAETPIVWNADNSKCPDDCFRPVAMAIDSSGRIFFSSDSTGEIYMITKTANSSSNQPSTGGSGSSNGSGGTSGGEALLPSLGALVVCFVLALAAYMV